MDIFLNPYRGTDLPPAIAAIDGNVSRDASAALALLAHCPTYQPTPCLSHSALAARLSIAELWVKDERGRMGLGSFKALDAAYAIAAEALAAVGGIY